MPLEIRTDNTSVPLVAYADGSADEVVLDGDATLAASTVYRCPIPIKSAESLSIQWQQTADGTGAISAHRFLITNENEVIIGSLNRADIWSDVSGSYAFTGVPAGTGADSEHYPIANLEGCAMVLELTTGGAPVTGVKFLVQVR